MKWILLVPGALVPEALAPDLANTAHAARLSELLVGARLVADYRAAEPSVGAPHWSWLALHFGVQSDLPVTAPYAWQALGGSLTEAQRGWIGFCDPVHMAVGRDRVILTDLEDAPLQAEETEVLLSLASDALRVASFDVALQRTADEASYSGLRIQVQGGRWFLLADTSVDLQSVSLDAVLGHSVHEHMPEGADARHWRNLANEIQMLWHTSAVNAAREQRGVQLANALWVHGGGQWTPLPASSITELQVQEQFLDIAVLQGWLLASAGGNPDRNSSTRSRSFGSGDTLSVCRALFRPFAYQDWESWLQRLPLLEERLERELAAARNRGASESELLLCGTQQVRTLALPLHTPWWRWSRSASRASAQALQRWLGEQDISMARTSRT